jgi:hypothetical protein
MIYQGNMYRQGGDRISEKSHEQRIAGKRGSLLGTHEEAGKAECRNSVPQMKGLKKLMLLVSNIRKTGREAEQIAVFYSVMRPPSASSL